LIDSDLLQRLRDLVGKQVRYSGNACSIIEVLEAEQALVVRCESSERVIQANQFGEATRRVQEVHTLPLFDDSHRLNPLIRSWLD
jgi:hypothetical protein